MLPPMPIRPGFGYKLGNVPKKLFSSMAGIDVWLSVLPIRPNLNGINGKFCVLL